MSLKSKFKKNILFAFIAQFIALFLNILISLFVPKLLDVESFGYWQLFIFYFGYVGFFHFGLNDGIYLKYGGMDYNDLDKRLLGSQFKLGATFQVLIACGIISFALFFVDVPNRQFVLVATAITLVLNNMALYIGFIFQAVNETKFFSISVMIDKLVFMIALLGMLLIGIDDFKIYICFYIVGKIASFCYCLFKGRDIVFSNYDKISSAFAELIDNIKIGINLMIANIAGTLIIGSTRFIIDGKWGIEEFGKFSLSLSMINFVLLFLSQVSMVLFPMLRQIDAENQSKMYINIRNALGIILPLAFICYTPLRVLLELWLPQYKESLIYLGILLPICTYNGKMNLLCITYMKVLRKEKALLFINLFSMLTSFMLALIGAYVFDDVLAMAILLVVSIAIRSLISEIYISRLMKCSIAKDIVEETGIVIVFMLSSYMPSLWISFLVVTVVYLLYLLVNKKKVIMLFNFIKRS